MGGLRDWRHWYDEEKGTGMHDLTISQSDMYRDFADITMMSQSRQKSGPFTTQQQCFRLTAVKDSQQLTPPTQHSRNREHHAFLTAPPTRTTLHRPSNHLLTRTHKPAIRLGLIRRRLTSVNQSRRDPLLSSSNGQQKPITSSTKLSHGSRTHASSAAETADTTRARQYGRGWR